MKPKSKPIITVISVMIIINLAVVAAFFLCDGQPEPLPVPSPSDSHVVSTADPQGGESAADKYVVGETLFFGSLEQDGDKQNGAEPIEWIILDKTSDGVLLLSKYGLMPVQYYWNNTSCIYKYTSWEESSIRRWLNDEFIGECFTEDEQSRILLTKVVNDDSSEYNTIGGRDTLDRLFFLSHAETLRYMPEDEDRKLLATKAAIADGAFERRGYCFWWLRTPGKFQCNAEYVFESGIIYAYGSDVGHDNVCARPAMWISFEQA